MTLSDVRADRVETRGSFGSISRPAPSRRPSPSTGEPSFTTRVGDALVADYFPTGPDKPGEVMRLDWKTGEILARRSFPFGPGALVWGGGALWLGHFQRYAPSLVQRIDPQTLEPIGDPLPVSDHMSVGLAYGDGMLWASASDDGELVRIDPGTGQTARVKVGRFPVGIALAGASGLRIARAAPSQPSKFPDHAGDRRSDRHRRKFDLDRRRSGIRLGGESGRGRVTRIDASTGEKIGSPIRVAAPSSIDGAAHALSVVGDSIWVTSLTEDTVSRIDPTR